MSVYTDTESCLLLFLLFIFVLVYDRAMSSGNFLGTQELVIFLSGRLLFLMLKKGWEHILLLAAPGHTDETVSSEICCLLSVSLTMC